MAAGATGGCGAAGDTGCACAGSGACPCALTAATTGAGGWCAGRGSVAVERGASSDRFGSRSRTGTLSRLAGARASAKGDGTSRFWVAGAAPWAWGTAAWAALPAPTACGARLFRLAPLLDHLARGETLCRRGRSGHGPWLVGLLREVEMRRLDTARVGKAKQGWGSGRRVDERRGVRRRRFAGRPLTTTGLGGEGDRRRSGRRSSRRKARRLPRPRQRGSVGGNLGRGRNGDDRAMRLRRRLDRRCGFVAAWRGRWRGRRTGRREPRVR